MKAGHELDALVAAKVMEGQMAPYSTDIAAAFLVAAKMRDRGGWFQLRDIVDWDSQRKWWADFAPGGRTYAETGETPALAICLAALRFIQETA